MMAEYSNQGTNNGKVNRNFAPTFNFFADVIIVVGGIYIHHKNNNGEQTWKDITFPSKENYSNCYKNMRVQKQKNDTLFFHNLAI